MIKGLLQKEWIKTKWLLLALYLLGIGMTLYDLLALQRVVTLRGAAHLWEILLTKDILLIGAIKYQPLFTGIAVAMWQFIPEMSQKRLKLTLHLPMSETAIATTMLGYGVVVVALLFGVQYLLLLGYTSIYLAPELVTHLLVSVAPWFLAGLASYGIASLVVLEPTWLWRVLYLLMGYGVAQLYFVMSTPRSYQGMLLPLLLLSLLLCFAPFLSIGRFKEGIQ